LILLSAYSRNPYIDFTLSTLNDIISRKDVLFWGLRKQNFIFRPHFHPKTELLGQFSSGQKISAQKGLNNVGAQLYLPLIVIVGAWKLYSE